MMENKDLGASAIDQRRRTTVGVPAIYERMSSACVRIESAWPFPVGEPPEALAEVFESHGDRMPTEVAALYARWSEEERESLFSGPGHDFDDAVGELTATAFDRGISGWLGVAATPVFKPHPDGNGASFSWGHYRTKLLFAETADGLLANAADWAEAEYAKTLGRTA